MEEDDQILYRYDNQDFDELDSESVSDDDYVPDENEELDDAIQYAIDLNLQNFEGAIDRVGTNGNLLSWIESKMKSLPKDQLNEYDKISSEIDMVNGLLNDGLKKVYSTYTKNFVIVSDSSVAFCKELFNRFARVVLETSFQVTCLRENRVMTTSDVTEGLKLLGRPIYYDKEKDEESEEAIFDSKVIRMLVDLLRKENEIEEDVYYVIQCSFEDFLYNIIQSATTLQRTYRKDEPVSVDDMIMVLQMWNHSPCKSGSYLIEKLLF